MGKKVPKRDRFGLWMQVEGVFLECFELAIEAALAPAHEKGPPLKKLRVRIDLAKRLVRLCQELGIIEDKRYFSLQEKLVGASKMAHGWLAYAERKPRPLKN